MFGLDLLQFAFNVQSCIDGSTCPGSTFNTITAAYSTLGYYWQADLLYFLTKTGLSQIAGLIYILAGFSGIMAMVLGAPPRNYVWFFIGPALYNWLVATTVPVQGVRIISARQESSEELQKEVWRLSAVGLHNSNYIVRLDGKVNDDAPPSLDAEVSLFFVWADSFVSDVIESLIEITGVYRQNGSDEGMVETAVANGDRKNWSILSDLKWAQLEDITSAKLKNGDVRDAFVTFLASECGDVLARQIHTGAWVAASSPGAAVIPESIFKTTSGADYKSFTTDLRSKTIPIPDGFKYMIGNGVLPSDPDVSFKDSANFFKNSALAEHISKNESRGGITCESYLWILIHAFQFEAGHIYFQLVGNKPGEFKLDPKSVVYNLLYGWGVGNNPGGEGTPEEKRKYFLLNLILAHLIRNELAIAPKPVDERYASAHQELEGYIKTFTSTVGSKTKYGEVYSWALMMPYIQGIMLYVLAAAYPFAALMVIIPGWHKTIVTWASFWLWVKIWDLGFAIVKVIERSVWAMIGNNPNMQQITGKVLEMQKWGKINVPEDCGGGPLIKAANGAGEICAIPKITFNGPEDGLNTVENTFKIFDRALTLASNLDLDLSNGYYIYIMAALYFAVPGVTGQIVLGAKAGASSLVGGMISGFSEKVSGAAQSGWQGDKVNQIQTNAGSQQQASEAKAHRTSGLMAQAIQEGNTSAKAGIDSSFNGAMSSGASAVGGAYNRRAEMGHAGANYARAIGDFFAGKANEMTAGASSGAAGAAGDDNPQAGTNNTNSGGAGDKKPNASRVDGLRKGLKKAAEYMSKGLAIGSEGFKYDLTSQNNAAQNEIAAQNADRSNSQFGLGGEQSRANLHGGRLEGAASYGGEMGAYRAKRNWSNNFAGQASVMGLFAGNLAAQKPRASKDSAMSGLLNTYGDNANDTAAQANYGDSNGTTGDTMKGQIGNYLGQLQKYSGQAVRNSYGNGISFSQSVGGSIGTPIRHIGSALSYLASPQKALIDSVQSIASPAKVGEPPKANN